MRGLNSEAADVQISDYKCADDGLQMVQIIDFRCANDGLRMCRFQIANVQMMGWMKKVYQKP
jgi:hypothetical protein